MHEVDYINPALVVALSLAVGIVAQALARHLRVPGIVLLLATGALLGPDGAGFIRPELLGQGLQILVGFAVAVILFEGGMSLDVRRLREQAGTIQRLVTLGALITAVGGTLLARLVIGWGWRPSILFGTLVTVTGPTVIQPLLRRVRVTSRLQTILEAEAVFIDAIGALMAVGALEVALGAEETVVAGVTGFLTRFGVGCLVGIVGGVVLALLLRVERLVPEGLENVFTLSLVLVLFQISSTLQPESGIAAAAIAGIVVGNVRSPVSRELREFKEQLTVMLIGMLFVLLAADVRIADVQALGWPGVATVLGLMLVVRPLDVWASTAGSDLRASERAFLSWLAPRGIVAAAVASLFAEEMAAAGIGGGDELRALVFLVIAVTVLVQGLSGGLVAQLLGVRRPSDEGYVILGAGYLGREVGRALAEAGEEVVLLDSNPGDVNEAKNAGFQVVYGNALEEHTLHRATLEARAGAIGLTTNEEVNLLFTRRARDEFKVPRAWVGLRRGADGVRPGLVRESGKAVLFGAPRDLGHWADLLHREEARVERWRVGNPKLVDVVAFHAPDEINGLLLPLVVQRRRRRPLPFDDETQLGKGHVVWFVVADEPTARRWLQDHGWEPAPPLAADETGAPLEDDETAPALEDAEKP